VPLWWLGECGIAYAVAEKLLTVEGGGMRNKNTGLGKLYNAVITDDGGIDLDPPTRQ